tara:strand:- start:38 stop:1018 length:981 start_codon:yes stop_codon:yes gene_type:complete
MAEKVEWIYVYHEPKRHPDLYEFGRTKRSVEKRNKEKRSVDPWKKFEKYAVADCIKAERDIIKATGEFRYCGSKEIIQLSWDKFEKILEPIIKKWSHKEYNKRKEKELLEERHKILYSNSWDRYKDKWQKEVDEIIKEEEIIPNQESRAIIEDEKKKIVESSWIGWVTGILVIIFIAMCYVGGWYDGPVAKSLREGPIALLWIVILSILFFIFLHSSMTGDVEKIKGHENKISNYSQYWAEQTRIFWDEKKKQFDEWYHSSTEYHGDLVKHYLLKNDFQNYNHWVINCGASEIYVKKSGRWGPILFGKMKKKDYTKTIVKQWGEEL